jgi:hypothetical protein
MKAVNSLACKKVEQGIVHPAHSWRGFSAGHRCNGFPGPMVGQLNAEIVTVAEPTTNGPLDEQGVNALSMAELESELSARGIPTPRAEVGAMRSQLKAALRTEKRTGANRFVRENVELSDKTEIKVTVIDMEAKFS